MENINEKKIGWWKRKKSVQKVGFIISVSLLLASLFIIFFLADLRLFGLDELADSLYGTGVENGWVSMGNALASSRLNWVFTALTVFLTFIFIFICNFITHLFDNKTRKAKTIASLIRSLVKYIVIIAAICFILYGWGVNIAGILAGVGVVTLIVGLGCQSLIQDVVSGIFIVFDDYLAVGDTVIVDGFRGTVVEVGLKTTKLQDYGGNIKSITNSSITTVVNMARLRSVASVTLSVSYNEDVERVEAIILKEIEELKTKVPNIIEGPFYKGIDSIGASSINFLVHAFCEEGNRFQVTRDMNREFYLCFKKHNIQIPYNQVTVNPEDEKQRPKATEEEKLLAVKQQKVLRGLEEKKDEKPVNKKARVVKKVKESLIATENDMQDF